METSSVFPPSCRSPFPCAGCPPSLATAWQSHEVFVKCLAVVHKTDVLTFRSHDGFGAAVTRARAITNDLRNRCRRWFATSRCNMRGCQRICGICGSDWPTAYVLAALHKLGRARGAAESRQTL